MTMESEFGIPFPQPRKGTVRVRDLQDAQRYAPLSILRDYIYTKRQAENLIKSIFKGIPIGYLATTSQDDGNTFKYIVGHQRIRTIQNFMADELKVNGRKYSEMCAEDRERFDQTKITMLRYTGLTDRQEEDLCTASNEMHSPPRRKVRKRKFL